MHFFRLALLACLAFSARAQTAPSTPPPQHTHAPAPASHAHGVVTLDQFVSTASPVPRNQVDLAQATTVLGGRSLLLKQQNTLGETLMGETGVHASAFGPAASRPIIRGLSGDRIRLLENSIGTLDASVTSPDHAVGVEPFLVDRIEILRGPAALLFGSNAVGGAVNVITHRIETDLPAEPVRGTLEVRGGTGASEFARGGVIDVGLKPSAAQAFVFHLDAFRRDADDLRIPGFAESDRIRAEETLHAIEEGERLPHFAQGRLPNSSLETRSGSGGVSFVSEVFHVGASYSEFESNYGVPGHSHGETGVRIDLRQRRTDVQAEWHGETGVIRGARFKLGHARYRHAEIESDGTVGTRFGHRGHEARFELLHGDAKPWSGAVGAQVSASNFQASGEEAFLPASRTTSAALFAFEEIATEPVLWQFGARFEQNQLRAEGLAQDKTGELSASLGAVWKLDASHALTVSATHTGRAANAQERLAFGPHAGTQSFEIGDVGLNPERALGVEASLRRRAGLVTGALTGFAHHFDGYIFADPTGEVAAESGDGWRLSPLPEFDEAALPVYRYTQRRARFWGVEVESVFHLHESNASQLDIRLAADLVRANSAGKDLPRIPASRATVALAWAREAWNAGFESQFVFAQNRVAPHESPSDGYTLLSAFVTRSLTYGHAEFEVFLRASNLLEAEARPHPSFVRELAPLGGRAVVAGVRVAF